MTNSKNFCLNDADDRFLVRFSNGVERSKIFYCSIGLALCWVAIFFGLAMKYQEHRLLVSAIVLGVMGFNGIVLSRRFKRLHSIITQMQGHIAKLESGESPE